MSVWDGSHDEYMRYRVSRLRERITVADGRIDKRVEEARQLRIRLAAAEKREAATARQLEAVRKELAAARKQLDAVERRVGGIEKRVLVKVGPALRRRARKLSGSAAKKP